MPTYSDHDASGTSSFDEFLARYLQGEPGIDVPAAKWLIDQGIVAIGADNMAVEVLPNPNHAVMMPVHQFALAECGVYLIENLALEELAAERIYAACFVLLATKIRGATGAPVRPIVMGFGVGIPSSASPGARAPATTSTMLEISIPMATANTAATTPAIAPPISAAIATATRS